MCTTTIMRGWLILASAGITSAGSIPSDLAFCLLILLLQFGQQGLAFAMSGSLCEKIGNPRHLQAICQPLIPSQSSYIFSIYAESTIRLAHQMSLIIFTLMINLQPALYGRILRIRPLKPQDFEILYNAASDPLIWQQHPEPQRAQRDFFKNNYFRTAIESNGALLISNTKNEAVGCSRYYRYRPQSNDISMGYTFLTRDYWGEVANREMKHLMMSHIYQWVDTIYFTAGVNNLRSMKAIEKIGGKLLTAEMQKERDYTLPGSFIYQIHKKDFRGLA